MRAVFVVAVAIIGGLLLLSCSRPRAPVASDLPPPTGYAPSASVDRTPLPPPADYVPPESSGYAPPPSGYAPPPPPGYPPRQSSGYASQSYGYAPRQSSGYAPRAPAAAHLRPPRQYGGSPAYAPPPPRPQAEANMVWQTSPRWASSKAKPRTPAVKREAKVKADPDAKFKAAQAKAAEVGVENLSKDDIEGLTLAQLKELRGY